MTYAEELDGLTRHLGALLAAPREPIDEPAVQAALSGRKALLRLLTAQLHEVAPMDRAVGRIDFEGIASHPVAALSAALRSYPRPHGEIAPSQLSTDTRPTKVGRLWVEIRRSATRAQEEWQGFGHALENDQAWTVVADVAVLAGTLASLDGDLAAVGPRLGCDHLTAPLGAGARLAMSVAASEVLSLARTGALPANPPLRRRREGPKIVTAGDPDGLIRALWRLAEILNRSGPVNPEHVQQITVALARSSLVAARGATVHGVDHLAELLRGLAHVLGDAATHSRRTAMAAPADPRPLAQAGEIARYVRGLAPSDVRPVAAAEALAAAVVSVDRRARRDLAQGHWLVPDDRDRAQFVWRPWHPGMPLPLIVDRITEARSAASTITALNPPADSARRTRPYRLPPRLEATTPRIRPALPAQRPAR